MVVCKFWLQGNCRFGNNCKFEHPANNTNRFGAFGAPSGGANALPAAQKDPGNAYSVSETGIVRDLTEDRPPWIFSSYGPGRNAPGQLFGGDAEQSFEELRLHHYKAVAAGNVQAAISDVQTLYQQRLQQIENAIKNPGEAMRFVLQAENNHPNRLDICKSSSLPNTTGEFAVGKNRGTQPNPFGQPAAAAPKPNAFAASSTPSPFAQNTGSTFGQPSALAAARPAFGQPSGFGQPSQLGGGTSAFGQPSALGQTSSPFGAPSLGQGGGGFSKFAQAGTGGSAFGQPSQLGAGTGGSAFGQPSQLGAGTGGSAFGQPSQLGGTGGNVFGKPSQPAATGASAFGQPSQLGGGNAFGQPSGLGTGPSPFAATTSASPFGQAASNATAGGNTASPFGQQQQQQQQQQQNSQPFGQPSTTTATANPFGQAQTAANPFGAAKATPFGAPSTSAAPSLFAQAGTATSSAPNPFQQAAQNRPAFGQPDLSTGVFGRREAAEAVLPVPLDAAPSVTSAPAANAPVASAFATNAPAGAAAVGPHPPIQSYASHDAAGRLTVFKGQPVVYQVKNGVETPTVRHPNGKYGKIWFPNGPPPYNKDTALASEAYTDAVQAQYAHFLNTGKFEVGMMPEQPPKREWCLWDF